MEDLIFDNIEKVNLADVPNFQEEYLKKNRPVVFKDLSKEWPAREKWTPEFFMEKLGQKTVKVYDTEFGTPGKSYMKHARRIALVDYMKTLMKGQSTLRMFLYNISREAPELINDIIPPALMKKFSKNFLFMFFGARGSVTQLHYDIDMSHVFHTTFYGKKTFYLFAPDQTPFLYRHPFTIRSYVDVTRPNFEKYPLLRKAKGLKIELLPGETLFIPSGYWHHVVYDELGFALSLRCPHQSWWKRAQGFVNVLLLSMIDRFINKIAPGKWYQWKERRARRLAESAI